jgi:hypothetical protein
LQTLEGLERLANDKHASFLRTLLNGATTLSIMTFSITTLSTMTLDTTENEMRHSAQWQIIVMMSDIMLNVVMLNAEWRPRKLRA